MESLASYGKRLSGSSSQGLAATSNDVKCSSKSVKKISDGLFTYMKESGHCYVMERVDHDGQCQWEKYGRQQTHVFNQAAVRRAIAKSKAQQPGSSLLPCKKDELVCETREPIGLFEECLKYYSHVGVEVWCAYVSTIDVNRKFRYDDEKDGKSVEMAVAVLTHKDAPFQMHLGIHRCPEHILGEDTIRHKSISMGLHGFSAHILREFINKGKQFVITSPRRIMAEIFKKHLDPSSYQEGCNFEGSFIRVPAGFNFQSVPDYKFSLLDSSGSGDVIFEVDSSDAVRKHRWFFHNIFHESYFIIKIDDIAKLPAS